MTDAKKQQQPIITFLVIFIVGFICGVLFTVYKTGPVSNETATTKDPHVHEQNQELGQAIDKLEQELQADPENYQGWVTLGHLYFDTEQNEKAIDAYLTSLKYHEGDADLLTDLGVMYRRTGQPEKAVEWFDKAQVMNPQHQPSRFNEGIVRIYDLEDIEGGLASWEELLKINPDFASRNGQKLKDTVDQMRSTQN
ncbi:MULTISPECIES: tetratricopeptide repeat protein [Desulfosediminicola]|uniref:tetratricopeptide repeat protein n=1 Tax=Desulfosediminicola TaxID=2886823 RepID=UPI0010AD3BEF|nr:tetratricopeptide repeat protein [Desulfosediminicola ganghwensis]